MCDSKDRQAGNIVSIINFDYYCIRLLQKWPRRHFPNWWEQQLWSKILIWSNTTYFN